MNEQVDIQPKNHHSLIHLHKVFWIFGVHLSGQVLNLADISGIRKQDHVVSVQTNSTSGICFGETHSGSLQ